MLEDIVKTSIISIHTPAKGVTPENTTQGTLEDFNPHSREGSDRVLEDIVKTSIISIHTPAKGVTPENTTQGTLEE